MKRLLGLACALTLWAQAAMAQTPSAEAQAVAKAVTTKAEWMRDALLCPTQLMPSVEAKDHLAGNDCKPGRLNECLAKCSAGTPGACYWLGQELQRQGSNPEAFETLYQRSCKLGVMSGCTNHAAGLLKDDTGDARARSCATATFDAACARDDPWACTMLAMHLSQGIGVEPDPVRALKVLDKSCRYGPEDEACFYAGKLRKKIEAARRAKPRGVDGTSTPKPEK